MANEKAPWETSGASESAPWDTPAPKENSAPTAPEASNVQKNVGTLEVAGQLASGAVSQPLSGFVGLSLGADAEGGAAGQEGLPSLDERAAAVRGVQENLTYQPKTEEGKRQSELVSKPFEKLHGLAEKAGEKTLAATKSPLLATAAQTAIEVAPALIPEVPKALRAATAPVREAVRPIAGRIAARGEEAAAVRSAEEAPKNAKIEQAKAIGLKIPPSEGGGAIGKALEGIGGKTSTEMDFSRANAKVINRTAAKEIGLSERQPLTESNLGRLKQKAFQVYDRVKTSGRIASDDAYKTELNAVRERTAQAEADYPEDTNELIDKEIKKFDRPSADASSMLEKIKSLRNRASKNMQATDAEKFELGIAQKKIATAMENLIDRQLQVETLGGGVKGADPGLIKDFRAARTQLAKIYNVEDALGPNGNLSAAVLARQFDRGVPLSGGLKTIAETYQQFPKVMRYVDNLGGHAPFSALDYLVGGVEAIAHPAGAARVVGALALRPVARAAIKSKAYQRAAIKPRETKPSVTSRVARKIAGPTLEDLPARQEPPRLSDVQ